MVHKILALNINRDKLNMLIKKYAYNYLDSDEVRLDKSLILIISVCCSICGLALSGIYYIFLGFRITTVLPLIFTALVTLSIFISHSTSNYKLLVYVQIICISIITTLIQWSLGSIYNSGFVLSWCFLSPLGAALFLDVKQSKIWMLLFLIIIGISVIFAPTLSSNGIEVTENAHIIFSLMNIGMPFTIFFMATSYFLNQLKKQKEKVFSLLVSESVDKEMRQFFTTANTPIFGADINGFINEWNEATEKVTGYKKNEVLGDNWLEYAPAESKEEGEKAVKSALAGKEIANYEFNSIAKDGRKLMLLVNISTRRNIKGEITGVLAVGQDITELDSYRSKLEIKVNERTIKLNKALNKEKVLNELKSKFVSTASHEFRTPLSAINFAAGSIKKYWSKMSPIMIEKKLYRIENQVLHMTELLDDILIVGQGEANKIKNTPIHLNLGEFISDIIDEVYHSYNKSHEILLVNGGRLNNLSVFMDEKLARNILINLLSNAIKFSPEAKKVTIEIFSKKNQLVISITDFGIGILKSEIKKIFNPFTRGENVALIKGSGLGLSIVKDAINILKGEIIVKSIINKGTTFIVKIPNL